MLKSIIENKNKIPDDQFGFREKHSIIDQVHRITDIIEKSLKEVLTHFEVCSRVFRNSHEFSFATFCPQK